MWLEINHRSDEKYFNGQHGRIAVSRVSLSNVWKNALFYIWNSSLSQKSLFKIRRKYMGQWVKGKPCINR